MPNKLDVNSFEGKFTSTWGEELIIDKVAFEIFLENYTAFW